MPKRLQRRALACLALAGVAAIAAPAHADDAPNFACGALVDATRINRAEGAGEWIELTPEQWNFLRGVFVEAPDTPESLPPGDHAAMAKHADGSASIVFVDGDLVCAPIRLKAPAVDILMAIGRGDIVHARKPGQGL